MNLKVGDKLVARTKGRYLYVPYHLEVGRIYTVKNIIYDEKSFSAAEPYIITIEAKDSMGHWLSDFYTEKELYDKQYSQKMKELIHE